MRKPIITLTLLFVLLTFYGKSKTTIADSSKVNFYKAYAALQNMLEGKDSLNYEKAVFITENAYHDNYFNYEDFKNLIDFHAGIINAYAENVRSHYKEKYKTLKPWEQTYFKSNTDNWAIFKYITDTAFVIINNDKYSKTPYNYTAYDPYGSDNWENTQVLSLLLGNEKQGNCYSLAVLFKLFSDRFQSDARLTITPHHIYIQNRNQRGGFYNVELASKTFPGDGTIQCLTYTTNTSIMNGMAQRMLNDKEAVALNLIYLAKGYQHKYKDNTNDFLLQCAGLAFKYDSLSMNALLLKAEVTENRLLTAMKANKIKYLNQARTNQNTNNLLKSYEKQLSNLYKLGYREIPKEIERNILAQIQHKNEGYILKDQTPNPFAPIKAKQRYMTLSNGLFDEMHEAVDTIQYYHALLNTKTKKIIQLLPVETDNEYKVDPVVFALSVDPLSDKYPGISPYAYCAWNPVMLVDPDGRESFEIDQESGKVKIVDKSQHYQAKNGSIISVKEGETYNGTENISEMKQIDKVSNSGGDNIYVSKGILDKKQNSNDYQMFSFRDANEASDFYYFAAGSTKAEYAFAELENKGGIVGTDFSDKNTKMTGFFEQNFGSQISLISHSHGGSGWPPSFDITDKNHRQVGDLNNAASSSYSFQREVYSVPNKMVYGYNGMTLGKARRTGISYDYNFKRR